MAVGSVNYPRKKTKVLTLEANGESLATYDGSGEETVNITYANVGAAPSKHTHAAKEISGLPTSLPANGGAADYAAMINGTYTGSGGKQAPSYIPSGKVRFNMMNTAGNYADWLLMDTYSGGDVPWVTALGIEKTATPAGWIMTGAKNGGAWGNPRRLALFTANPESGQVLVSDGTVGGVKTSGYTIATSVPSNAKFTDTVYQHPNDASTRHVSDSQIAKWNGKADDSHTHSYLPLSGGTITGRVSAKAGIAIPDRNCLVLGASLLAGYDDMQVIVYPKGWSTNEDAWNRIAIGATSSGLCGIFPADNFYDLGRSNYRFKALYAVTGTIQTSDARKKKDIKEFDDEFIEAFVMGLIPVSYMLKQNDSGRTHYGLIAQDVENLMNSLGMDSKDFAGFIKSPKYKTIYHEVVNEDEDENGEIVKDKHYEPEDVLVEGEYDYSLRYEEFISPVIKMIQLLKNKVDKQQEEIERLKSEIKLE